MEKRETPQASEAAVEALTTQLIARSRIEAGITEAMVFSLVDRLREFAEQQIGPHLQSRIDPDDPVDSALGSFFRGIRDGQFTIAHSGAAWRLLAMITLNKIRREARSAHGETHLVTELRDEASRPESAVVLSDEIDAILHGMPADCGDILCMRLQGMTVSEIATRLNCSRWTVRRRLDRIGVRILRRGVAITEEDVVESSSDG